MYKDQLVLIFKPFHYLMRCDEMHIVKYLSLSNRLCQDSSVAGLETVVSAISTVRYGRYGYYCVYGKAIICQ